MKGGDNDVKLCTLLDKSTGKMLKDAAEVTDHINDFFQQQERPASGRPKMQKYMPGEVSRSYNWEHGAYKDLDPCTLETEVGKPE